MPLGPYHHISPPKAAAVMGPGEGRWDPWGPARAGLLKAVLLLLLLDSASAQTTAPRVSCGNAAAPKNVSQPRYAEDLAADVGAGFMSPLVQSFLNTVQPWPFPHDLILMLTTDFNKFLSDEDARMEVLRYETGFLVCVAIGIVYIVLMPLVGIFLACCRCCGNCGGEMYQKQTSNIHCWRRTLYWSLFVTTAVLLAGNVCMFHSNQVFMVSVDRGQEDIIKTIDNLQTYITDVPEQINYVVNASYKTVNEVTENLDDIGPELGSSIQQSFEGPLEPALDSVVLLDRDAVKATALLKTLNESVDALQRSSDGVQADLSAVRDQLRQTLRKPSCLECAQLEPELDKLTVDTALVTPNLSGIQNAVDEVIEAQLPSVADDYLDSIPQRVTNATLSVVQASKSQLEIIKGQISQVADGLPVSALKDVSEVLVRVQQDIDRFSGDIEDVNHIKWGVGLLLCCLVLLVVLCNVLGLILGPAGLESDADPRERSCTSGCGGTFLMMGAGFSFLYCWLFMILVLLLFILGGNLYTLGCKPWHNGDLLQVIDASGLVPPLPNNVTLGAIHRDCRRNLPIWATLRLSQTVDLEELLNVSKYTSEILLQFENMDLDLSTVTLLSPEVQQLLRDFPEQLKQLDFTTVREQMANITRTNLNETADKVDTLADLQPDTGIKAELRDGATGLRAIQTTIETIIFPQITLIFLFEYADLFDPLSTLVASFETNLTLLLDKLEAHAAKMNGTVALVSREVGAAQDFMDTNTTLIAKAESRVFINCQIELFDAYADWAILMLTQELGRCGPVSGAVDAAALIICSNLVESLNAFWFSLGWCMMFFIPSIIFSIKLSKYYRRMKRADEYDKHIAMNQIPRATMLNY